MYRIRDWLYVGKYRETLDAELLRAQGIGAVLQLADPVEYPDIDALYLNVVDGELLAREDLRRGLDFINTRHQEGKTIPTFAR
jgi:hypothetical protein